MENITIPQFKFVQELLDFIDRVHNHYENKDITLDFSKVQFINPYHISVLSCFVDELIQKGNTVHVTGLSYILEGYLKNIGFLDLLDPVNNLNEIEAGSKTSLKLWKVNLERITAYSVFAVKFYGNNKLFGQNLDALNTSLVEVLNNIVDHSGSPVSGYVTTQLYPQKSELITSF